MLDILQAFFLIFIAEMGDKTQILAMAFATKYPVKKVLLGIFIGSFLNHGLAVLLGNYISDYFPISNIQIIAGFAFIFFALWSLKSEDDEDEEESSLTKFGPVLTVATAFFVGELGDKTQLTAITLASTSTNLLFTLIGTVSGMIVTGGIGIYVGKKLGDKIPEFTIKITAATIFMIFGTLKLYNFVPKEFLNTLYISAYFIIILSIGAYLIIPQIKKRRAGEISLYVKTSDKLYKYYKQLEDDLNDICLGKDNCEVCMGGDCIVGYGKSLISDELNSSNEVVQNKNMDLLHVKEYDISKVQSTLNSVNKFLEDQESKDSKTMIKLKNLLEKVIEEDEHKKKQD